MLDSSINEKYKALLLKASQKLLEEAKCLASLGYSSGIINKDKKYLINSIMLYLELLQTSSFIYYQIPEYNKISKLLNQM